MCRRLLRVLSHLRIRFGRRRRQQQLSRWDVWKGEGRCVASCRNTKLVIGPTSSNPTSTSSPLPPLSSPLPSSTRDNTFLSSFQRILFYPLVHPLSWRHHSWPYIFWQVLFSVGHMSHVLVKRRVTLEAVCVWMLSVPLSVSGLCARCAACACACLCLSLVGLWTFTHHLSLVGEFREHMWDHIDDAVFTSSALGTPVSRWDLFDLLLLLQLIDEFRAKRKQTHCWLISLRIITS